MDNKNKKVLLATFLTILLLAVGSLIFSQSKVFGYGYYYGYGYDEEGNFYFADTDVSFNKDDKKEIKSSQRTHLTEVNLDFDHVENATHYMISDKEDFSGENWKGIEEGDSIKLEKEKNVKQKFYVKFKAVDGYVSEIFEKTLIYQPKKRYIKNSPSKVERGDIITQSGKRFSKNSDVALYFYDLEKNLYPNPVIVKTDDDGKFSVDYVANKSEGKYKWYAVDLATGRKSEKIYYRIK